MGKRSLYTFKLFNGQAMFRMLESHQSVTSEFSVKNLRRSSLNIPVSAPATI
jgi:hypothetical protein